jgi:hypothetical protein
MREHSTFCELSPSDPAGDRLPSSPDEGSGSDEDVLRACCRLSRRWGEHSRRDRDDGSAAPDARQSGRRGKAFAKSGLPLVNPEAGFMVTTTTLSLANTAYPFTLGVTIYPTVAQAERSFSAGEGPWRKAGYAVAIARNVIVAVVPRGSTLERKAAKPFAMPAKVAASIARLS